MASLSVNINYHVGLVGQIFRNARLVGSWDSGGTYSDAWTEVPMAEGSSESGSQLFRATVQLDENQRGWRFRWGVLLDTPGGANRWGIATEVNDRNSTYRHREFTLAGPDQVEEYHLTHCRRLGANKYLARGQNEPGICFAVWAPNAQAVEMVRGNITSGYIADDGNGATSNLGQFPMVKDAASGTWGIDPTMSQNLARFSDFDHTPYMFRITRDDGAVAYRTDLYSRCQIGSGKSDPKGSHYTGSRQDLDGSVSCSVVIDPERVMADFNEPFPQAQWFDANEFWRGEFDPLRPVPTRMEDLVIYEMHVGGLGAGRADANGNQLPGTLGDAIGMLDYLFELGVNAVELLPMAEFEGWATWGYGTSHFSTVEFSGGGRDHYKYFVRECHRRGIAVIQDVVYNHYIREAERAEWMYDAGTPEKNIYYWYEGLSDHYARVDGGYVDNMSTGFAPRYWEEMVRKLFISSAAALIHEFHVDGLRVDQTTSIHGYAVLHANGAPADDARIFGQKFLRELTRTLKLIRPSVMLMAEDHSEGDFRTHITLSPDSGGLGFDSVWYAAFYHHLVGDADNRGPSDARLLKTAGMGDSGPLAMDYFAGALAYAGNHSVVYHESHDEAGNSAGTHRTIVVAVNRAALVGETRRYAEARSRLAAGLSFLSPGTPMFFMGEETAFQNDYSYDAFLNQRQDFAAERNGNGRNMFRFYQDLIKNCRRSGAARSPNIDILHVHNDNRVIVFHRFHGTEHLLVFASFNDTPFSNGYRVNAERLPDALWREIFNSDSSYYGGNNVGNGTREICAEWGDMNVVIPANGFVVLRNA